MPWDSRKDIYVVPLSHANKMQISATQEKIDAKTVALMFAAQDETSLSALSKKDIALEISWILACRSGFELKMAARGLIVILDDKHRFKNAKKILAIKQLLSVPVGVGIQQRYTKKNCCV